MARLKVTDPKFDVQEAVRNALRKKCQEVYWKTEARNRKLAQIDRWIRLLTMRKEGKTYQEIGAIEGISRERVSQLVYQAMRVAERRLSVKKW